MEETSVPAEVEEEEAVEASEVDLLDSEVVEAEEEVSTVVVVVAETLVEVAEEEDSAVVAEGTSTAMAEALEVEAVEEVVVVEDSVETHLEVVVVDSVEAEEVLADVAEEIVLSIPLFKVCFIYKIYILLLGNQQNRKRTFDDDGEEVPAKRSNQDTDFFKSDSPAQNKSGIMKKNFNTPNDKKKVQVFSDKSPAHVSFFCFL